MVALLVGYFDLNLLVGLLWFWFSWWVCLFTCFDYRIGLYFCFDGCLVCVDAVDWFLGLGYGFTTLFVYWLNVFVFCDALFACCLCFVLIVDFSAYFV